MNSENDAGLPLADVSTDFGMVFIPAFFIGRNAGRLMDKFKKKGGNRMNRRPKRRFRKRRDAGLRQQILRKEAKRETKYPLRTPYGNTVLIRRSRNRGA